MGSVWLSTYIWGMLLFEDDTCVTLACCPYDYVEDCCIFKPWYLSVDDNILGSQEIF